MEGNDVEDLIHFFQTEKYAAKLSLKFKKALQLLEDRVHRNHENLGLSIDQFEELIRTIISKTTSLSRSILNLPDSYGCQLMQSLVPKETVPSELILELAMKILTSFRDNKKLIEQTLRWLNCILQYSACQTDEMEVLYELLLPLLQRQSLTSLVIDLLLKITSNKKYIITKRRVEILQEVEPQRVANVILLRYQNLRPDLVKEKISMKPMIRRTAKHFDGLIERTFGEIWSQPAHKGEEAEFSFDLPPAGVKLNSLIPSLSYETIGGDQSSQVQPKHVVNECKSVQDLVSYILQGLKMPDQALSLLNNPTLCTLLLLNPTPTEIQERLSITLYFTLHNEFLSMSRNQKQSQTKQDLLRRINMLQESLQHGLPVVGRFLAEYFVTWNGNEYFIEICKMLSFMPITDFAELDECILGPIRLLCNGNKLPWRNQIVLLHYLAQLVQHWALLLSSECGGEHSALRNELFPWANTSCDNPFESINGLCDFISQQSKSGFCQLIGEEVGRLYHLDAMLSIFSSINRCFVRCKIPIRPEVPAHFIYFSVFGRNPVFFSKVLDHLTVVKKDIIPMCHAIRKQHFDRNNLRGQMATLTEEKIALIENVAKDVIATVDIEKYLSNPDSIFRKEWSIEDDYIREMLSLKNHPVHIPYLLRLQRSAALVDISSVSYEGSVAFEEYWRIISQHAPCVTRFLKTFRSRSETLCKTSQPSIISTATRSSGLGSMDSSQI